MLFYANSRGVVCQALLKRKVTKPYSPAVEAGGLSGGYMMSPNQMPSSVSLNPTLGAVNTD